jgi:hypothetical protein
VALLLGASNSWFAVTRSALSIPAATDPLGQLVSEHIAKLRNIPSVEMVGAMLGMADELRPLLAFPAADVWAEIEARRDGGEGNEADLDLFERDPLLFVVDAHELLICFHPLAGFKEDFPRRAARLGEQDDGAFRLRGAKSLEHRRARRLDNLRGEDAGRSTRAAPPASAWRTRPGPPPGVGRKGRGRKAGVSGNPIVIRPE